MIYIVEQLRQMHVGDRVGKLAEYAADEIEALRADFARLSECAEEQRIYLENKILLLEADITSFQEELSRVQPLPELEWATVTARLMQLIACVAQDPDPHLAIVMRDGLDAGSVYISRVQDERSRLRKFAAFVMQNSWDGDHTDGGEAQDKALSLGLIEKRPCKLEDSVEGETEHYYLKWQDRTIP